MTLREFSELVYRMREAQGLYFRMRDRETLIAAKELEKAVDQQIIEIRKEKGD